MNKRQWKKNYKKEHGCNPPSIRQVSGWGKSLGEAINTVVNGIKDMVARVIQEMKDFAEELKTMPEDEFKEKLQKLTPEQQELARKIRGGEGTCGKNAEGAPVLMNVPQQHNQEA